MTVYSRIIYSIFLISLVAAIGCNRDNGCGYFGNAEDLKLSYYSYECDGDGIRNGAARVEYGLSSDSQLAYEWDIEGSTSDEDFINLKGSGPMEGFVRVTNTKDGCFIYKNVDMLFNMPHGTIGNKVWIDSGSSGTAGMYDSSDEPAVGIKVELLDANNELLATDITDDSGTYLFEHLADGEYLIKIEKPAGYTFCPPNLDPDEKSDSNVNENGYSDLVTLSDCEINLTIDAGLIK